MHGFARKIALAILGGVGTNPAPTGAFFLTIVFCWRPPSPARFPHRRGGSGVPDFYLVALGDGKVNQENFFFECSLPNGKISACP
ncbi:hypothetical protein BH11ARM1_BH11ARM1_09110 [soil metagenome]